MERYFADVELIEADTIRIRFGEHGMEPHILTTREIHTLWAADDYFCQVFSQALADAPFDGFFWETPPLRPETYDAPFECVVVSAPSLARQRGSIKAFAAKLAGCPADLGAIAFENLGGDATLVVPVDRDETAHCCHLASFLRTAELDQIKAVWDLVGQAAPAHLARYGRCWISTSGLGVPWLHVRIDALPKYYSHAPYRSL